MINKESFNWGGLIVVVMFIMGLIYFLGSSIWTAIEDKQFLFPDRILDSLMMAIFGVIWLVSGIWTIPILCEMFSIHAELVASAELTAYVKVISKCSVASPMLMPKTSVRVISTSYYVSFEFHDGSRKNFSIEDLNQYNTIIEGEQGVLTYKEYKNNFRFLNFKRKAE